MPLQDDHAALLPDDIRDDPTLQNYNDFGGMAKGLIETKALVGRSIQLPAKDSKPEDFDKWANETGAKLKDYGYTVAKPSEPPPGKPDDYDFKVEGFAPEVIKDDIAVKEFRTFAHQNGLSNAQANKFVEFYAKNVAPKIYEELHKSDVEFVSDPQQIEDLFQGEFNQEAGLRREEAMRAIGEFAKVRRSIKDTMQDAVSSYGTPPRDMKALNNPDIIWMLSEIYRNNFSQEFAGHLSGLTAGDTLESVNSEIDKLRKEAMASNDQIERGKLGEKISNLYKKQGALSMRKASNG